MEFWTGVDGLNQAAHLARAFVSANVLVKRKSRFKANRWIMDSGAFTIINRHGCYPEPVTAYAQLAARFHDETMAAIVAQDYMCEAATLARTGLTIEDHQRLTIERYDALLDAMTIPVPVIPVLQGFYPDQYRRHLDQYGDRLGLGHWVGIGSVCKRNGDPIEIVAILAAIKAVRPDLRIHGFGVKQTALYVPFIRNALYSADSMAWAFRLRAKHWETGEKKTAVMKMEAAINYAKLIDALPNQDHWESSGLWTKRN